MFKLFYASAWVLATIGFLASVLTGKFDAASAVLFSLIALILIYSFALWSVLVNTRDSELKIFDR